MEKNKALERMQPCPVCGAMVEVWDICDVCGWEYDVAQNKYPDAGGGANVMSLNQAREAYKKGEKIY